MAATRASIDHATSVNLNIPHLTVRVDLPRLDRVVVIDRARATHGAQLRDRRLHMPGFVDSPALQQRRRTLPGPVGTESRQRLRQHRLLQPRLYPVATAVG